MNSKIKKIILSSLFAAICCIATMLIKIPSPLKGYINLGDCIVLVCGWLLSPFYAFLAAGLGSALADVFSGYLLYAPATFVIKGGMALVAFYIFKVLNKRWGNNSSKIFGGILAEILMVVGYYIFEGFLYGFAPSLINVPANCVQGVAGLIIGMVLIKVLEKSKINYI